MDIRTRHSDGKIVFEFPKAYRFDIFVVSNADEKIFWELKPSYLQPANVAVGYTVGIRAPSSLAGAIGKPLAGEEESDVTKVSTVVYGEVPDGYRETTKAIPLVRGETYALLVFDDSSDSGGVHFVA